MLTLAIAPWVVSVLVAVFLFACVVLILTVLIQRPQGGGLSGAFGAGGGAGQTAFGTKTGDALTIATVSLFIVFLGLAIGLNFVTRPTAITPATPTAAPGPDADPNAATTSVEDGAAEGEANEDPDVADLIVPPTDDAQPEDSQTETPAADEGTPAEGGAIDDAAADDGSGGDAPDGETPPPGDG
ncbi:MAG: preprotein translocase subunit SecG [Phycisphaerales bacterium]